MKSAVKSLVVDELYGPSSVIAAASVLLAGVLASAAARTCCCAAASSSSTGVYRRSGLVPAVAIVEFSATTVSDQLCDTLPRR